MVKSKSPTLDSVIQGENRELSPNLYLPEFTKLKMKCRKLKKKVGKLEMTSKKSVRNVERTSNDAPTAVTFVIVPWNFYCDRLLRTVSTRPFRLSR